MESLSIGQVVLATFPFSDLTTTKLRPCLVIGLAEFNDVLLCQITSKNYGSRKAIALARSDFIQGELVHDSFVRPNKIATLNRSRIKQTLGAINDNKLDDVKQGLKSILEIS
ncbi:MAG TPA: type II toxin-antitoxin system PemK/MazF family toxin [Candidatus Saccharimonadales bacterium]|jgi:mRNA interferase MazF|nr:type II toxin-antitoxin system PemK/MazF family toxin [Candidatus Saccharimonadales bacterium]